jgi:oxygen-independent coproporphyrinogen-3 oxidase
MLGIRLAEGLDLNHLGLATETVSPLIADGLLDRVAANAGKAILTRRGRLLADAVVRALG